MKRKMLSLIFFLSAVIPFNLYAELGQGCLNKSNLAPYIVSGEILGPSPGDRLWDFKKLGAAEKSGKSCSSEIFDYAYQDMWDYWDGRAKSSNCAEDLGELPSAPPTGCNAQVWKNLVANQSYLSHEMAKRPVIAAQPYSIEGDAILECPADQEVLPDALDELLEISEIVADQSAPVAQIPSELFSNVPMSVSSIALESLQGDAPVCPSDIPEHFRAPSLNEKTFNALMYGSKTEIYNLLTGNAIAGLGMAGECVSNIFTSAVSNILNTPSDLLHTVELAYDAVKLGAQGAGSAYTYATDLWEKSNDMAKLGGLLVNDFYRLQSSLETQLKNMTISLMDSFLESCRGMACYNEVYIANFIGQNLCKLAGEIVAEVGKAVVTGLIVGALTAETGPFAFLTGGGSAVAEIVSAVVTKFPKVAAIIKAAIAYIPDGARVAASAAMRAGSKAMSESAKLLQELRPAISSVKSSFSAGLEGLGVPKALAGEVSSYLTKQALRHAPGGNIILTLAKPTVPGGKEMVKIVVRGSSQGTADMVYDASLDEVAVLMGKTPAEIRALLPKNPPVETIYKYLTPASARPDPLDWVTTNMSGTTLARSSDGSLFVRVKQAMQDLTYKVIPPMSDELADSLAMQGLFP